MDIITFGLLVLGGIFTGGVLNIAISRYKSWNTLDTVSFKRDFTYTVKAMDVMQPAILAITMILTFLFAINAEGISRVLAFAAALSYFIILALSLVILVPLQNSIISSNLNDDEIIAKKQTWQHGHLGRASMSIIGFSLAVAAVVVSL